MDYNIIAPGTPFLLVFVISLVMYTVSTWFQPRKPKRGSAITCRISNVPATVSREEFATALNYSTYELCNPDSPSKPASPIWSYSRSGHSSQLFVATASFDSLPAPNELEAVIKRNLHLDSSFLRVDLDFFGLTPLVDPENATFDIVAVTGLAGHAFGSWKSRNGPHMWLRDFLPQDVPDARIMIYGYDTKLPGSQSTASILELSRRFLESLKTVRCALEQRHRPILFIGHSLGGLVVKQALVNASQGSRDDMDVFRSCYALLLFGVPNRGLEINGLRSMVQGQPNEDLVRDLRKESSFLDLLHQRFCDTFHEDSQLISIYETKQTRTVQWSDKTNSWARSGPEVMMVPKSSAVHSGKNEKIHDQQSIDADHSDIVKFYFSQPEYLWIMRRIRQLVEEGTAVVAERLVNHKRNLSRATRELLKTLKAPDYQYHRNHKVEEPATGTLHWILQLKLIKDWLSDNCESFLWIRGTPGQGKSVLTKYLIKHLENGPCKPNTGSCVLYFFFYDQDERFTTMGSLLRSFIEQLLMFVEAEQQFGHTLDLGISTELEDGLWTILEDILHGCRLHTVYCIVDALDECREEEPRKTFLQRIKRLFRSRGGNTTVPALKLVVTSRPIVDISRQLQIGVSCLDLKANEKDLRALIASRMLFLTNFGPGLRKYATDMLLGGAGRTFLWIAIVLRKLEELTLPTRAKLQEIVTSSPTDLDKLYRDIVDRIMQGPEEEQRMLVWMVYSRRPLSLTELEAAVATRRHCFSKASTEDHRPHLGKKEALASAAGIILEITDDGKVHLFHQSIKDFLLRTGQLASSVFLAGMRPELYLAETCICYLNFEDFQAGPCRNGEELGERKHQYPLLQYASHYWHFHIKTQDDVKQISKISQRIVEPKSPTLLSWAQVAGIPGLDTVTDTWAIASKANIAWLIDMESEKIQEVTMNNVLEAARDPGGYMHLESLARRGDVKFTTSSVSAIARDFDEGIMRILLERDDFQYTTELLEAAARNTRSATSVTRVLLRSAEEVVMTDRLVKAAGRNRLHPTVMEMVLRHKNVRLMDSTLLAMVRYTTAGTFHHLPEGYSLVITSELLKSLCRNTHRQRDEIFLILFSRTPGLVMTNQIALLFVRKYGERVIEKLLESYGKNFRVNREVLEAACRAGRSQKTMELLLHNAGCEDPITQGVLQMLVSPNLDFHTLRMFWNQHMSWLVEGKEIYALCKTRLRHLHKQRRPGKISSLSDWPAFCQAIEMLIRMGAGVNAQGSTFDNALLVACLFPCSDIARTLVDNGANVNVQGGRCGNALSAAAHSGCLDTVKMLLDKGVAVNRQGGRWGSALQAACAWGSSGDKIEIVQLLLTRGADVNARGGVYGCALAAASARGREDVVRLLLDKGAGFIADVGSHNHNIFGNALEEACASKGPDRIKIVHLLMSRGADVNTRGDLYGSALAAASLCGNGDVVSLLLYKGADINADLRSHNCHGYGSALQAACISDMLEPSIIDMLIQAGANVNMKNEQNTSALQLTCYVERKDKRQKKRVAKVVRTLLDNGAFTGEDTSSLELASARGYEKVVKMLIEAGEDVDAIGCIYRNALEAASEQGYGNIVVMLIEAGASLESNIPRGVLAAVSDTGHEQLVQLLLDRGVDVDAISDEWGESALIAASSAGHMQIVKMLLGAGADVNAKNLDGDTALQGAVYERHHGIIRLLLEAGADVNAKTLDGETALEIAHMECGDDIVKLLLEAGAVELSSEEESSEEESSGEESFGEGSSREESSEEGSPGDEA